ncbi:MAG: hypothetical protein LBT84_06950 [Spirochaetia bacterium]|nr:hypothetical protein [Spirochaetia bacterium]
MGSTAIMVDGGFYQKRANALFGKKSAKHRSDELVQYCQRHLKSQNKDQGSSSLYRIFYYDCPPSEKVVFHPLTQKHISLLKSDQYAWYHDFFTAIIKS